MAYEVVKTIGSREYRYRVTSERDATTGKRRNRWTYLGRVASERPAPSAAARPVSPMRLRLLEAAERLLASGPEAVVTAGAIAAEADAAHGTFYRYFVDRADALRALAEHLRATGGISEESLRDDVASAAEARAGLRSWVERKLHAVLERAPMFRGWYALMESDAQLRAFRIERRETVLARMVAHFRALTALGFADVRDPEAVAHVLYTTIDGLVAGKMLRDEPLDERRIAATVDLFERTIFGC